MCLMIRVEGVDLSFQLWPVSRHILHTLYLLVYLCNMNIKLCYMYSRYITQSYSNCS